MSKSVRTLTGDVPPKSLGRTLIHEHLSVDWGEMLGRPKVLDFEYDAMADRMVGKLQAASAVGFGAMVECTPIGCGRYLDLFKDVGVRRAISSSTGGPIAPCRAHYKSSANRA